ncbi:MULTISPECIES: methyltransferase domain-containing protein [Prochlorococcus]|uniref:SAM-dependent methyltransferase n=1 Tax=Prochlorococcus marinus (strain SARG / CCMP1375 / SS120) TaxID=167539 RepID=Q7VAL3_PROMA|nr:MULTISPECIES: methyltransferase domain-containing protein [Prochlorococcus]AAQ00491.1 SAM-dependent methyltransferase [Prochlorococcus marinus subsp. marinus str. CCMP1375]KGG14374.1 hypothetical protein EV04_0227 [Prochlorococcus marinus str. LG]KGG22052.1 hypothetical protein EV08_0226 [Prochlorococcus marinus str. SS2]KGG24630.1 hypothetical protein EV09_0262 [Prochlorococcus marinus str. SS35]KGG33523.1 hypothetical protein EV10_0732 [Prochlorococcus marinus str. SS51]
MSVNVLTDIERVKEDSTDDSIFYAQPRFVTHLDDLFLKELTDLYRKRISKDSIILDLMSSWISHLPKEVKYKRVIGHGLNQIELERNDRLDSYWVQNLNIKQKLPLEDSSIDVCLMVAAWQYLQYPEELAFDLKRIIKPKGKLIVSFSNRAFWSKAPLVWTQGSDLDHINYIKNVLVKQGWAEPEVIVKVPKKEGFLGFLGAGGDPFFSVIASNI